MVEISKRLILRFDEGQFTFRAFDAEATDEQIFNLAGKLNALQEDEARQIATVRVLQFM